MSSSACDAADRLLAAGRLREAYDSYARVLQAAPNDGAALFGLGRIAFQTRNYNQAADLFKRATASPSIDETAIAIALADALNGAHKGAEALEVLATAAAQRPDDADCAYHLAKQQIRLGAFGAARKVLDRVIATGSDGLRAHGLLEISRLPDISDGQAYIAQITEMLARNDIAPAVLMVLHYAIGNILDSDGDYTAAFDHYLKANALQLARCSFKTADMVPSFRRIAAVTPAPALVPALASTLVSGGHKDALSPTPIFILGLPRTGSTLLEQMLARHSDVCAGGELPYIGDETAPGASKLTGRQLPDAIAALSDAQSEKLASLYCARLAEIADDARFVTDKQLFNFQWIGLIKKLFPSAKVINVTRTFEATALSVLQNYFADYEPYFCSLSEFNLYHEEYQRLMNHWRDVAPGFVHDVAYETLIAQTEATMRGVLEFCGLDWQTECLRAQRGAHAISTLSNVQARAPVHEKALSHWKNYERLLQAELSADD